MMECLVARVNVRSTVVMIRRPCQIIALLELSLSSTLRINKIFAEIGYTQNRKGLFESGHSKVLTHHS